VDCLFDLSIDQIKTLTGSCEVMKKKATITKVGDWKLVNGGESAILNIKKYETELTQTLMLYHTSASVDALLSTLQLQKKEEEKQKKAEPSVGPDGEEIAGIVAGHVASRVISTVANILISLI
jgi:hypothetical protein